MNIVFWLAAAALDWSIIAAAFIAVALDARALPAAWLIIGNRQHALAILMHEAAHGSIARARWLNDLAARLVVSWPLGIPLDGYRQFHLAHHVHLNDPDDPEQLFKTAHPSYLAPRSKWRIAADLAGDLAFQHLTELRTFYRLAVIPRDPELLAVAFVWLQAALASTALGLWWLVPLWAVSFASVTWGHNRLRIWLEHSGAPAVETWRVRLPWPLEWILRPHRVGLHWEHHRHPKRPWWRLRPNVVDAASVRITDRNVVDAASVRITDQPARDNQ